MTHTATSRSYRHKQLSVLPFPDKSIINSSWTLPQMHAVSFTPKHSCRCALFKPSKPSILLESVNCSRAVLEWNNSWLICSPFSLAASQLDQIRIQISTMISRRGSIRGVSQKEIENNTIYHLFLSFLAAKWLPFFMVSFLNSTPT